MNGATLNNENWKTIGQFSYKSFGFNEVRDVEYLSTFTSLVHDVFKILIAFSSVLSRNRSTLPTKNILQTFCRYIRWQYFTLTILKPNSSDTARISLSKSPKSRMRYQNKKNLLQRARHF